MIKSKTMLAVLLLTAVAQGVKATVWKFSGSGTESNPYSITSEDDWNHLAENVNDNNKTYEGEYFELSNNIKFTKAGKSIGTFVKANSTNNKSFKGIFDGCGHTISGFTINNGSYQGLFGYIGNGGTVMNIVISGLNINVTANAGAVAGRNEGTINGIIVNSSTIKVLNTAVGGIAGNNNEASKILNCHVLENVTIECPSTNSTNIGGIVGNNTKGTIENCSNAATINIGNTTTKATNYIYSGGIAGFSNEESTIKNCLYLGSNLAATTNYGSIVGRNFSTLQNNYYTQATTCGVANLNDPTNSVDITANDGAVPALRNDKDNTKALELLAARSSYLTSKGFSGNCAIRLYGRTLYKDGYWNTLCLPFDVTLSNSVLNGATVKTLESSSFGNGTLTLNFSSDLKTIPAGKPCIIKWANGDNLEAPLFNNVAVSVLNGSPVETINVDFIGTFSPKTLTANDNTVLYLGANSTLYYPSADVSLNACRAYFQLKGLTAGDPTPSNSTQNVRAFTLNFGDGEVSGIVDAKANPSLSEWYSLSGRCYATPTALPKGVYIHNGRKVVIK